MSMSINSEKKIKYFEGVLDQFLSTEKNMDTCLGDLRAIDGQVRMAGVDRAYNSIVGMATIIGDGIDVAAKACLEVLENLAQDKYTGEALVAAARRLIPVAEAVISGKPEFTPIEASVIAERGMDENWTATTQAALSEKCTAFIAIRRRFIEDVSGFTARNNEEDFRDVYMTIGRGLEETCNGVVEDYNRLKAQLEQMNVAINWNVDQAKEAASKVGAGNTASVNTDLTGAGMDV